MSDEFLLKDLASITDSLIGLSHSHSIADPSVRERIALAEGHIRAAASVITGQKNQSDDIEHVHRSIREGYAIYRALESKDNDQGKGAKL